MSRLRDRVRELAAAASPGPWVLEGIMIDAADGEFILFPPPADAWIALTPEQRVANAALAHAFGSPDRALAAVEALEGTGLAGQKCRLFGDNEGCANTSRECAELCSPCAVRAVLRSWEQALGIAEEQSDGS